MIRRSPITTSGVLDLPPTRSDLWLPETGLAGCIRAVLVRDTRGVALTADQRLNHFGVSPFFSVTWFLEGGAESVLVGDVSGAGVQSPRVPLPGPVLLTGPSRRPWVSYNPGPVSALMLVFEPDALYRLAGLRGEAWLERTADAREALPPDWRPWLHSVLKEPTIERALSTIEDFLVPRWSSIDRPGSEVVQGWVQSLALRVAMSGAGRSLRQFERRFRAAAGQPFRSLQRYARNERAYVANRRAWLAGRLGWAAAAASGGYADQSHLVRESVMATGFPPGKLAHRCATDESFWIYRLWC